MLEKLTEKDIKVMKMIGDRIRQLRDEKGLSQFQLSVDADLTKNQIGRIERAEHNTSLVSLNRIADALEVPLNELFLFEE